MQALPEFIDEYIATRNDEDRATYREIWNEKLETRGWQTIENSFSNADGQRIFVGNIGPVKNQVSVAISMGHIDFSNRWLFQQTALAGKYRIVKIPILLVPLSEFAKKMEERFFTRMSFEQYLSFIEPLTPFSHAYPFLILGYTNQTSIFETQVFEIDSDPLVLENNIVVDRCIEFPPEYYQAGLNILNFFGTYIREQYPDENAKVKIEQNDKVVRLIIETEDGKKETIEKALEEYQLVITGQRLPEEITDNTRLILELKSELRLAKYRIETQQDIMAVQGTRIDKLLDIVANGLINRTPINIDFKPNISVDNKVLINQNISSVISDIDDLKLLLSHSGPEYLELLNLEGSLIGIEKESNPDIVRKSTAMTKLKKFIETVTEGNEQVAKIIKSTETGIDIVKNLAGKYNSIAEWCGLPQVPKIFTK